MGMPSKKRVGDSLERSSENKKKQKENTTKKILKWDENEMDLSLKSFPKSVSIVNQGIKSFGCLPIKI